MAPLAPNKLKLTTAPQRPVSQTKPMSSAPTKTASKSTAPVIQERRVAVSKTVAKPATELDEDEGESEKDAQLRGLSSDEDSSDDDGGGATPDIPGIDVSKLPTVAKDDATVKRKLERAKRNPVSHVFLPCILVAAYVFKT